MDNASNNDTMMKELAQLLHDRDIAFDSDDRRIRCFAHIIDLSSKCVVEGLSKAKHSDDWVPTEPTEPTTLGIVTGNPGIFRIKFVFSR